MQVVQRQTQEGERRDENDKEGLYEDHDSAGLYSQLGSCHADESWRC